MTPEISDYNPDQDSHLVDLYLILITIMKIDHLTNDHLIPISQSNLAGERRSETRSDAVDQPLITLVTALKLLVIVVVIIVMIIIIAILFIFILTKRT